MDNTPALRPNVKLRCVICSRPFCGHAGSAQYEDRSAALEPVSTEVGESARKEAIRVLSGRYRALAESSKTFSFSSIEGTVMDVTGEALDELSAMAPTGPLLPATSKDWFGERLPLALPQT